MRKLHYYLYICTLLIIPLKALGDGQTVVFLNSYHPGYPWSDALYQSFSKEIKEKGIKVHQHFMHSKNMATLAERNLMVKNALAYIEHYQPDVIVASDDNASKFVIQPYFKNHSTPVVFLGVNLNSKVYDYPYDNATGIEEIEGLGQFLEVVEHYTGKTRFAMLFTNTTTSKKKFRHYQKALPHLTTVIINDFKEFQQQVKHLASINDYLVIDTMDGLTGYDEVSAREFLQAHSNIPTITVSNSAKRLVNFGYLKVPQEHGLWAAKTTLKILNGTPPKEIPIAKSNHFQLFINDTFNKTSKAKTPSIFYDVPHVTLD